MWAALLADVGPLLGGSDGLLVIKGSHLCSTRTRGLSLQATNPSCQLRVT